MNSAVPQFLVVQTSFLCSLSGELSHTAEGFTLPLALLNLLDHCGSILGVDVQVIVQLLTKEVVEELLYAAPVRLHVLGAKLGLCLALKYGFLNFDADSSSHPIANVSVIKVLP